MNIASIAVSLEISLKRERELGDHSNRAGEHISKE